MRTNALLAITAAPLLAWPTMASAVADQPVHLNQKQATEWYQQLRFLLHNDLGYCGAGQVARSGDIHGGGNPMGGGSYAVINFSKGAKLKVDRTYQNGPERQSVDVHISCSYGNVPAKRG